MEVNIGGKIIDYTSDFDPVNIHSNVMRNWKVSAGDYFKFPVKIGDTLCFIKRFNKRPSDISGYDFLVKIKGRKLRGLPLIYDVVQVNEHGKNIIYLFTEFIKGDTLDSYQRNGFSFLPSKLSEDLFYALQSIHENGFWFPDFDPKNLFRSESGDFYFIDLDSTYPIATMPANSMYGSKDYWAPVYEYYRLNHGFTGEEVKKIRGDVLNILNLLYLLGLYSFYLDGDGEDMTGHSIGQLNRYLLEKHKIFSSTLYYCCNKDKLTKNLTQRTLPLDVFRNFVSTALFTDNVERTISGGSMQPQIVTFTVNGQSNTIDLMPGQPAILEWNTENTTSVKLMPDNRILAKSGRLVCNPDGDTTYSLTVIHKYKTLAHKKVRSVDVNIFDPLLKRPVIEFFVENEGRAPVLLESASYRLKWSVSNATKVLLDDIEVPGIGHKDISAARDVQHTIKALNQGNGSAKKAEDKIPVTVEKRPVISLTASSTSVKSGEKVNLKWNVLNGGKISILQNGVVIASDRQSAGEMDVTLSWQKGAASPQPFKFSASTQTPSGKWTFSSDPPVTVNVRKKVMPETLAVSLILLLLVIIFIAAYVISSSKKDSYSGYNDPVSDSLSYSPVDSAAESTNYAADSAASAYADTTSSYTSNTTSYALYEDFNSNWNNWPVITDQSCDIGVRYGRLRIEGLTDRGFSSSINALLNTSNDYSASVTAKWTKGVNNSGYGLLFASNADTGADNFFGIAADGSYGIFTRSARDNDWVPKVSWTSTSYVTKNGVNILSIHKSNYLTRFYINGNLVTSLATETYGTNFGCRSEGEQVVEFDDFQVSGTGSGSTGSTGSSFYYADPLDGSISWPLYPEDGSGKIWFNNNALRFDISSATEWFYSTKSLNVNTREDFVNSATANWHSGSSKAYGIFFCCDKANSYFNYFLISSDGYYKIGYSRDGNSYAYSEWTRSYYINEQAANVIAVKKAGETIRFYINGNNVKTATFNSNFGNDFGLYVEGAQSVDFKDFLLKGTRSY